MVQQLTLMTPTVNDPISVILEIWKYGDSSPEVQKTLGTWAIKMRTCPVPFQQRINIFKYYSLSLYKILWYA